MKSREATSCFFVVTVSIPMTGKNKYYTIAIVGAIVTFLLQVMLMVVVDPYIAAVLSPFYPVWIVVFVIGWRKQHPRR